MKSDELLTPSRQAGQTGTIDSPPCSLPIATFEIRHLTFFHQDNELVWSEIMQGWFVSKLETVTEITRSNWRAQVWHTCVHGRVGRIRFWLLHGDLFSLVKKKKKWKEAWRAYKDAASTHSNTGIVLPWKKTNGKQIKNICLYTGAISCTSNGPSDCATNG